jgi:chromosome segregation ATPase
VPSPESVAAFVVRRAHDIARELPDHMVHQAETERQLAEATTAAMIDEARARSAEIIEAAQRDRERVGAMIDEAHRQLDFFREQANDAARERVQQRWQETSAVLAEVEVELAALRAERHAMLSELSELDEALEASRAQLRRRDAIEVDVVPPTDTRVDRFGRQPERPRWALMPVEW